MSRFARIFSLVFLLFILISAVRGDNHGYNSDYNFETCSDFFPVLLENSEYQSLSSSSKPQDIVLKSAGKNCLAQKLPTAVKYSSCGFVYFQKSDFITACYSNHYYSYNSYKKQTRAPPVIS